MISGQPTYPLTLACSEVAAVDLYLETKGSSLERKSIHASFSASAYGITINFPQEEDRRELWDLVLEATREDEDE